MSIDLEFAIKKDIRNNPLVREIDLQQRREFRQTLTIVGLVVAMLLFWAWPHLAVANTARRLEDLRLDLEGAAARNRHLRLELESISAPYLIEERALRTLSLVPATEATTMIVERVTPSTPAKSIVADARPRGGRQ